MAPLAIEDHPAHSENGHFGGSNAIRPGSDRDAASRMPIRFAPAEQAPFRSRGESASASTVRSSARSCQPPSSRGRRRSRRVAHGNAQGEGRSGEVPAETFARKVVARGDVDARVKIEAFVPHGVRRSRGRRRREVASSSAAPSPFSSRTVTRMPRCIPALARRTLRTRAPQVPPARNRGRIRGP